MFHTRMARIFPVFLPALSLLFSLQALTAQVAPQQLTRVEPGLENAVKWKWNAVPSPAGDWGLPLPEAPPPLPMQAPTPGVTATDPDGYVVKRGDALILIAKKYGVTVDQLKLANGLTNNLIRVGEVLKIPTPEEIARMPVPATIPAPGKPAAAPGAPKPGAFDPEILLFQIYLDGQGFSPGPIDGKTGLRFQKLMFLYQNLNADARDIEILRARAQSTVGDLLTTYTLKPEDFRFIAPPKAQKAVPRETPKPGSKTKKPSAPTPLAPPTYEDLTTSPMLAYRSPWEFVAERFHCDEALLRSLNPSLKTLPAAGTEFRVPNVDPFEIEKAFFGVIQPAPDMVNPTTALMVDLSRLEIYQGDRLVAVFPVVSARPALRGRGTWKVLDAIPKPRLATLRESREKPQATSSFFVGENATITPETPVLAKEEFLAAGPRNPVGVLWINLAKSDDPEVLPFGLHGTSIPDRMSVQESLGGFRLTNWDILRAARLLPPGTPLRWQQSTAPSVRSAQPIR